MNKFIKDIKICNDSKVKYYYYEINNNKYSNKSRNVYDELTDKYYYTRYINYIRFGIEVKKKYK
jgi:hypothetical protein